MLKRGRGCSFSALALLYDETKTLNCVRASTRRSAAQCRRAPPRAKKVAGEVFVRKKAKEGGIHNHIIIKGRGSAARGKKCR